jgi:phosphatidylserine/phosphatidylglycerophosphate/cardiolipin synthase-like enzyme
MFVVLHTVALMALSAPPADLELAITVPVETKLGTHGLRSAKDVWLELIDSAQSTLELGQFYVAIKPDSAISEVIERLRAASARGVKIRMIADQKMEAASAEGLAVLRTIAGLEVRLISFGEGVHHGKYLIADGRRGYLGSQNFDWRSLQHIHELGVRLEIPELVTSMRRVFERDFASRGPSAGAIVRGKGRVDLIVSPLPEAAAELARLITTAQSELEIELLDYCPLDFPKKRYYSPIDTALRDASARGVRVRLLVSHWNTESPCVAHLKSLAVLPNVDVRIVTIPEASSGFIPYARVIHAKYMVVDGTVLWLGTSNWGGGYFDHSRNMELAIRDRALATRVKEIHRELWSSPYAQPIEVLREYPAPKRN